jgi:hypothetical protein
VELDDVQIASEADILDLIAAPELGIDILEELDNSAEVLVLSVIFGSNEEGNPIISSEAEQTSSMEIISI